LLEVDALLAHPVRQPVRLIRRRRPPPKNRMKDKPQQQIYALWPSSKIRAERPSIYITCWGRRLNALIQPFQQPERVVGFFSTYRHLYPVSRDVLRGVAEQFQGWVKE